MIAHADIQSYPPHMNVVDVTRPPYSAAGDGRADDTAALQRALNENVGRHRVLYFPKGTYLVSATLRWPKKYDGHDNWGKTMLRGADRDGCVLRLKDATFTDGGNPAAIMWCGGFGSADWFHNHIENLTFDAGAGNPGAVGLQFYSNNTGAVRGCRFTAQESSGAVGLDLAHRDMNGPLLVADCEVTGFACGIATGHSVNSQTFENITLRGQRGVGFRNEGQTVSIRGLVSDNAVPAVSTYGNLLLLNAALTGRGGAGKHPAIVNFNGGRVFLRDVGTAGYARALADIGTPEFAAAYRIAGPDKPGSLGPDIPEYCSRTPATVFPSPAASLRLPVRETPLPVWEPAGQWAVVDAFGADPTAEMDSSQAIQKALDSGAATVFFPGQYRAREKLIVRGKVRRMLGLGGAINYGEDGRMDLRLADGDAPVLFVENFAGFGGGLEIDTRRTIVLRNVETETIRSTARSGDGEIFLENVCGGDFRFRRQRVWARQLNIENEGTHLTNDGGDVWVLGYKTERGGTLAHTLGGGRTEILGGFSYTTTEGKLAPMFVNDESSMWAFFGEICYNGDPFTTAVRETRAGVTGTLGGHGAGAALYSGYR
ncbi:MAG: hypothetical protein JWM59_206 [Verrucomicrobiales bacterium]|nr:hypothetical protein [Verrucomicrobiales bacterium]